MALKRIYVKNANFVIPLLETAFCVVCGINLSIPWDHCHFFDDPGYHIHKTTPQTYT